MGQGKGLKNYVAASYGLNYPQGRKQEAGICGQRNAQACLYGEKERMEV